MSNDNKSPAAAEHSALNNFAAQQLEKGKKQANFQQLISDRHQRNEEQAQKREELRLLAIKANNDATLGFVNTAKHLTGIEVFNAIPDSINKSNIDLISRFMYTEFWIIKILTPADFEKLRGATLQIGN
jgi:hypothetical protein